MNWKCKLGFHDWQTVERKTKDEIEYGIKYSAINELMYGGYVAPLKKRICLRCKKYEDDITPYEEKYKAKLELAESRRKLAKQMCLENETLE